MPLHVSSTCAHHQEVKFYYTASGIITPIDRLIQMFQRKVLLPSQIQKMGEVSFLRNVLNHLPTTQQHIQAFSHVIHMYSSLTIKR